MKKIINLQVLFALLLIAGAPLAAMAQVTTYFYDNFSNGSTTNGLSLRGGSPTASYTSYDIASTKNTIPGTNGCTITPNLFHMALGASTSSGFLEAQAMLVTNAPDGTNAIALAQPGDYIDLVIVFTNTAGTLLPGTTSTLWFGLFNSGGSYYPTNVPVPGALAQSGLTTATGSTNAAGNCANWQGYYAQIENGGNATRISARRAQGDNGTSAAQDLLGSGVGSGAFNNPTATTLETAPGSPSYTFTAGGTYTMRLVLTLTAPNVMTISNYLYSGPDTNGTVLLSHGTTNVSGANFLTGSFDGLAIGALNKVAGNDPIMDISSISITGTNTVVTTPPTITLQPSPVIVATNGACAFFVNAVGFNVSYQWQRNGTNLLDQNNVSGSKTSMLVVSSAGTNDMLSGANGYYATVTGTGGYSTNSVTNSLTLIPATNLYYSAGAWDAHNSSSWDTSDSGSQNYVFDFGDPVNFGNNGGGTVTLNGPYLSAASVTMSQSSAFLTWTGSGSFAGPGNLIYNGSAQFTINNANSYSGGTIISNASANLRLGNLNGLGTGPVTLVQGGPKGLEITISGSASSGIVGDVIVANDFTIQYDGLGAFATVFLSNLSGTSGKTLTIVPSATVANTTTNNRVRVYGGNTTYDANLFLNDPLLTFASYNSSGSQTYNGVISGSGAFMQKGTITYLNGANTYSGGTFPVSAAIALGSDSVGFPAVTSGPIGTGPLLLTVDSTTTLTGSGMLLASGGARTIANPIQYTSGTNNLTLAIGGTNDLTLSGAFTLNGNDNITTNTFTARTVQVTNTGLTTLSGVISDLTNGVSAGYGFIKTGNGVLALNNTETYTGPTTVSGGTLQVNGALNAASAVTVTNATLAGTGNINGPVTVTTNGILAPGAASIGTLNINNSLTLSGNIKVRVNRSSFVSDNVVVSGALTNAGTGTVTVTNFGSALQLGDTFFLFNKALSNGAPLTVIGGGVAWGNNLAVNGSIVVVSPSDTGVQLAGPASVSLGANITNTLTVTNAGPGIALGMVVTDTLPANVTFVSASNGGTTNANAGQVVWSGFSLAANTATNFTLSVKAGAGGNVTNTASVVSSAADPSPADNTATLVTAITTTIIPTVSPNISSFSLVGGNVVINGTNGQSSGTYYLLASTNVATPLSQWTTVATNIVNTNGASGAFTFTGTNVASPGAGQQFYILSNTNN